MLRSSLPLLLASLVLFPSSTWAAGTFTVQFYDGTGCPASGKRSTTYTNLILDAIYGGIYLPTGEGGEGSNPGSMMVTFNNLDTPSLTPPNITIPTTISATGTQAERFCIYKGYNANAGTGVAQVYTNTVGDCANVCAQASSCKSFTFDGSQCYLGTDVSTKSQYTAASGSYAGSLGTCPSSTSSTATKTSTATASATPTSLTAMTDVGDYCVWPGEDIGAGSDLGTFNSISTFGACQAKCTATSACTSYTWNKAGYCYLSSTFAVPDRFTDKDNYYGGSVGACSTFYTVPPGGVFQSGTMCVYQGYDAAAGQDRGTMQTSSVTGCASLCQHITNCKSFTFNGAFCYMSSTVQTVAKFSAQADRYAGIVGTCPDGVDGLLVAVADKSANGRVSRAGDGCLSASSGYLIDRFVAHDNGVQSESRVPDDFITALVLQSPQYQRRKKRNEIRSVPEQAPRLHKRIRLLGHGI